jgi:hypothetical protein
MRWGRGATGSAEPDSDLANWRDADLRAVQRRAGLRTVRVLAWATALTGFVVLMMEIQRDPNRCHPNCFDGSDNTFEAGHVWTAYAGSWQWEAQLVLGWGACLFGLWALYAAGRKARWQTVASLGVSLGAILVWIAWVTVQPSPLQLG